MGRGIFDLIPTLINTVHSYITTRQGNVYYHYRNETKKLLML